MKIKENFVDPFKVMEKVSEATHKLELVVEWKIHDVLHVSLLKPWQQQVTEVLYSPSFEVEYAELEDSGYEDEDREVDKILRYRKYSKGSTYTREYLVLFKNESIENATWVFENYFCDEMIEILKNDIKEGNLEESKEVK